MGALEREATRPWSEFSEGGAAAGSEEQSQTSQSSPWRAEDPTGMSYRLMQYNPPYTLPWLRTNAIAVKVSRGAVVDTPAGEGVEAFEENGEDRQGAGTTTTVDSKLPSTAS